MVPLFTGATILCFSFLGFDGLSSLSEETPNAGKVIPRAIVLTALIGGIIFVAVSYFLQLYFPDLARFKEPDAVLPEIASTSAAPVPERGAGVHHGSRAGLRHGRPRRRIAHPLRDGA